MKNGSLNWNRGLERRGQSLERKLEATTIDALSTAIDAEAAKRLQQFAAGVEAYQSYPRPEMQTPPPCVWEQGSTRLLHYGALQPASMGGPPVLVIPSLINRYHILDLNKRRSLLRALTAAGLNIYLIDWGTPKGSEADFTLTDYIAGRLQSALDVLVATTNKASQKKVGLIGYCMGGLLALALAHRAPQHVGALSLLATPWDFHCTNAHQGQLLKAAAPALRQLLSIHRTLPVDVLQSLFASVDPFQTIEKFRTFSTLARSQRRTEKTDLFVQLEDWLNDGVPLAGPVAEETLIDWYGNNTPALGLWKVGGQAVIPKEISVPTLVVIPDQDRIVPPGSARALALTSEAFDEWTIDAGHIGMVTGSKAENQLYQPLSQWLKGHI